MQNIESRISIAPDVDATAEAVGRACGISKPRVLGTFARYGQLAGAEAILGPLGKSLGDVLSVEELAPKRNGRKERRAA